MSLLHGVTMGESRRIIDFNGREFIYTGEIKNGMACGQGKGVYTGFYENRNNDMCFSALYKDNVYTGAWLDNKASGYGVFYGVDSERNSYEGYWLKGRHHGFGCFACGDTKYIGFWEHAFRHGHGILKNSTGIYEGPFEFDKMHGKGVKAVNGKEYRVEYKNNKLYNGYCVSKKYTGWIKNGKREGFGIYKWKERDVCVYKGFHKNDKFHGKGVLISPEMSNEGEWVNGKFTNGITTFKRTYVINGKVMFKGFELNERRKELERKKLMIVLDKLLLLGTRDDIEQILISIGY